MSRINPAHLSAKFKKYLFIFLVCFYICFGVAVRLIIAYSVPGATFFNNPPGYPENKLK